MGWRRQCPVKGKILPPITPCSSSINSILEATPQFSNERFCPLIYSHIHDDNYFAKVATRIQQPTIFTIHRIVKIFPFWANEMKYIPTIVQYFENVFLCKDLPKVSLFQ
mmetsp:Transcript_11533/g.27088  ORF Transcript_11533/g.27088 Transcript_11533/m.27088 type:complete len:109 (-) Transcript_11533:37-363(-)